MSHNFFRKLFNIISLMDVDITYAKSDGIPCPSSTLITAIGCILRRRQHTFSAMQQSNVVIKGYVIKAVGMRTIYLGTFSCYSDLHATT